MLAGTPQGDRDMNEGKKLRENEEIVYFLDNQMVQRYTIHPIV
jgi:hypothetical protein